jgi:hypothetical protein
MSTTYGSCGEDYLGENVLGFEVTIADILNNNKIR